MLNFTIVRHQFFASPNSMVRFSEHSPPQPHCDKPICDCTREVSIRPAGDPYEISQVIKAHESLEDFELRAKLDFGPWFTFMWKDSHAYFMFEKDKITVEMTMPGYGRTDCFFGNVFFGNNVDISTLMNGHAPSRIIKLDEIRPDQVWVHNCIFGHEAMRIIPDCNETRKWRWAKEEAKAIADITRNYSDPSADIHDMRQQLETNEELTKRISELSAWLLNMVKTMKMTELYLACDAVYQTTNDAFVPAGPNNTVPNIGN